MERFVAWIRGLADVHLACARPEAVLNACAAAGIRLYRAVPAADGLDVQAGRWALAGLRRVCAQTGTEMTVRRVRGAWPFAARLRGRTVLLFGLALCILAVWASSLFVWQIDVQGNTAVPTGEILAELEKLGVGIGACRLTVDHARVSNEMLRRVTALSWIAVNFSGSRAQILVREETPAPERVQTDVPSVICAKTDAVLQSITVCGGDTVHKAGDTVRAGDVLVTGRMDSLSSGTRFVQARALVRGRTWHTLSASMPLAAYGRETTGEKTALHAFVFGKKRVNLYFDSGIFTAEYDRIIKGGELSFFGSVLPTRVETTDVLHGALAPVNIAEADAAEILRQRLTDRLLSEIGESGRVLDTEFEIRTENGAASATLRALCDEDIGEARPMTAQELEAGMPQNTEGEGE